MNVRNYLVSEIRPLCLTHKGAGRGQHLSISRFILSNLRSTSTKITKVHDIDHDVLRCMHVALLLYMCNHSNSGPHVLARARAALHCVMHVTITCTVHDLCMITLRSGVTITNSTVDLCSSQDV